MFLCSTERLVYSNLPISVHTDHDTIYTIAAYHKITKSSLCFSETQTHIVRLTRAPEGLGFSIIGGYASPNGNLPIYIKTVFERGAAARDGSLKRGDQLLAVNEHSLEGATHEQAVAILKSVSGVVDLKVLSS